MMLLQRPLRYHVQDLGIVIGTERMEKGSAVADRASDGLMTDRSALSTRCNVTGDDAAAADGD